MSRPIIVCEGISKQYKLGRKRQGTLWTAADYTLAATMNNAMGRVRDFLKGTSRPAPKEDHSFWALRDVSFEVGRGEVVGLIGRNGAGKSTLLKILSRIVEPTRGTARLRGRVASLLEVGTGFHSELTGRENIYMNGAILGMKKAEIDRKLDAIIAFAEIESFLETPVKRYSSGMYVRLAFAVAAHLEPEILIVDEVLAVGDYAFQKKCLGKMQDVAAGHGRTVLFVSHNMASMTQLCQRGILLEEGTVAMMGPVQEVVQRYLQAGLDVDKATCQFRIEPDRDCQLVSCEIRHRDGRLGTDFHCDEPVIVRLSAIVRRLISGLYFSFILQNIEGVRIFVSELHDVDDSRLEGLEVGRHTFEIAIPPRLLAPTSYVVSLKIGQRMIGGINETYDSCCEFSLRDLAEQRLNRPGVLSIRLPWNQVEFVPEDLEPVRA